MDEMDAMVKRYVLSTQLSGDQDHTTIYALLVSEEVVKRIRELASGFPVPPPGEGELDRLVFTPGEDLPVLLDKETTGSLEDFLSRLPERYRESLRSEMESNHGTIRTTLDLTSEDVQHFRPDTCGPFTNPCFVTSQGYFGVIYFEHGSESLTSVLFTLGTLQPDDENSVDG